MNLEIQTPEIFEPLLEDARYKGGVGGRGSGKSHFFAELLVEEHLMNPDLNTVCVREIQKSLKFSAKKLVEEKISSLGVSHLFEITLTEIRRKGHKGIIIFQGLQDHTADSIKSLEGFDRAWVEEAQSISARSMEMLLPTIRKEGSQIWFSWNRNQPNDPVEKLFEGESINAVCVHANYTDNPFLPKTLLDEADRHLRVNPDSFGHVWLGEYNTRSDTQVFKDKWRVSEDIPASDSVYIGLDFGFANDPSAAVRCQIKDNTLYITHEAFKVGLEIDHTGAYCEKHIPDFKNYQIRADSARPETISFMVRQGYSVKGAKKGAGSIVDGIEFIRSFDEIVIHPRCINMITEFRLYSYKVDKYSDDILPVIVDDHNHGIDALRYALEPIMRKNSFIVTNIGTAY